MHVYDPIYGRVKISLELEEVYLSKQFRRLSQLRQMGLCCLAFPGGNHTRFEHCLGTAEVASKMAYGAIKTSSLRSSDGMRLRLLTIAAAMCHDIGHGPFSHMTENVLVGLGSKISHEAVGSAIVRTSLRSCFSLLEQKSGITPELIASVITHTPGEDPMLRAASTWVSSDLDADRIDYLNRDSYYMRGNMSPIVAISEFSDIWSMDRVGSSFVPVLTDKGVRIAERILMARRDNNRELIFESRHMAATGMFEKAMVAAIENGGKIADIVSLSRDAKIDSSDADLEHLYSQLRRVWPIYGLNDSQLMRILLHDSGEQSAYLIDKVKRGDVFYSAYRLKWAEIHSAAREVLLGISSQASAFRMRRRLETRISEKFDIEKEHILIALSIPKTPKRLMVATGGFSMLADVSPISRMLEEDVLLSYSIELYVDGNINYTVSKIVEEFKRIFLDGLLIEVG